MKPVIAAVTILVFSLNVFAYTSEEVIETCNRLTRYAELCISKNTPPIITKTCVDSTGAGGVEFACIENQVPPEIAWSCARNSSTYSQQEFCLVHKIDPEKMEYCRTSSNRASEKWNCLENAAGMMLLK